MDVRAVALAIPVAAAALVAAARGVGALDGVGGRSLAVLAVTVLATLAALAILARRRTRFRVPPPAVELLLRGTAAPLGDAALVFEPEGRLVWANDVALGLSPEVGDALLGRRARPLGEDLATLRRGLDRGPAAGRVRLETRSGSVTAAAAALRMPGDAPVDVILLRLGRAHGAAEPAWEVADGDIVAEPPPLPARLPGAHAAGLAGGAATALSAQVGAALARAAQAAALLRMAFPSGRPEAAGHLDAVEEALREADAIVAAVVSPIGPPVRRAVDVDDLLSDALVSVRGADAIQVTHERGAAEAIADPTQLRQALRHLLQLAIARMPCGGALSMRTRTAGTRVVVEIADSGASVGRQPGVDLPLAQRLVAAQGGTVELARSPGRGSRTRVTLPAAAAARAAGA